MLAINVHFQYLINIDIDFLLIFGEFFINFFFFLFRELKKKKQRMNYRLQKVIYWRFLNKMVIGGKLNSMEKRVQFQQIMLNCVENKKIIMKKSTIRALDFKFKQNKMKASKFCIRSISKPSHKSLLNKRFSSGIFTIFFLTKN